ncbi:ras and EF-hand domain-containing homolog, partial [Paramuricea clavata]
MIIIDDDDDDDDDDDGDDGDDDGDDDGGDDGDDDVGVSEAEKQRTEQEFRSHKANMVPQLTAQNGQSQVPQASDEQDGRKIPLSPRTSPAGTETEVQTEDYQTSLKPERVSNIQRVYKVVFVGDSGVGKSSFIHRYCYEIWKPSYTATI